MKRFTALLILEQLSQVATHPEGLTLDNPCANPSSSSRDTWLTYFPATSGQVFDTPCTTFADQHAAEVAGALPEDYSLTHALSYDPDLCSELIGKLFNLSACVATFSWPNCFDPTLHPAPRGRFLAISSFYWEFAVPLGIGEGGSSTATAARDTVEQLCLDPTMTECETCSETDCFETSYALTLLTDGFHFDDDEFELIEFVENINGQELSWTLGFAVNASAGDLERDYYVGMGKRKISVATFSIMMLIGWVVVALSLVAFVVFRRKHFNRYLHRPEE